ncbi:MAG: PAS domain-containing protein, partial [Desulfobulbaceae bacterium]|nr:PAS domain-containing protein [Desulfobulbaceae bacterium]
MEQINKSKADLIEEINLLNKRIASLESEHKQQISLNNEAHKGAEERLHEKEEQLHLFIDSAPVPIAMFDTQMHYIMVSQRWLADYGLVGQDLRGQSHYDVFPDVPERWKEIHRRCLAGAVERADEDLFERADGRKQWLHWEVRPWHVSTGEVGGIIIFAEDITGRKRAEGALRSSERLLQDVMDGSPSPIFLKDLDGKFIAINAVLERMLGRSREEIIGKTDYDIASKEAAEYWRRHDKEVMATGQAIQIEEMADLEDGHHVFLANKFPLVDADGKVYGVGAISHDITARKRAEEALARMSKTLSESQKIAHMGSFEYIVESGGTVWSEEEFRIYGLDPAGPSPDYAVLLAQHIHPDDAPRLRETFTEAMRSGAIYEQEHRIVRPDGSVRFVHNRAHPFFDAEGKLIRYVGATLDITDRKMAEKIDLEVAAAKAAAETAQAKVKEIQEAHEELKNAQNMLIQSAKMAAVGILSAGVAHELNNPLTGILALARDHVEHDDPNDQESDYRSIMLASERMARIVKGLLDFSRPSAGDKQELNCNDVIAGVLVFANKTVMGNDIDLRMNLDKDLP